MLKGLMERRLQIGLVLDTNRINSRGKLPHMNRLEKWGADGVIYLFVTDTVHKEAERGGDKLGTKAWRRVGLVAPPLIAADRELWNEIAATIFPNGVLTDKQRNDVQIVFTTAKFGLILITNDGDSKGQPGGILGHAKELRQKHHIRVMRDFEAVDFVEKEIAERDALRRRLAALAGIPLDEMVESN